MGTFVNTDEFKAMNVGCVLDESMPSPGDEFILCYAERVNWREFQYTNLKNLKVLNHAPRIPPLPVQLKVLFQIKIFKHSGL